MSEDIYTFDESGIKKVADATRRVQQLPYGGDGPPHDLYLKSPNWVYLTNRTTVSQSGSLSNPYISTSVQGVNTGSYTTAGFSGVYFDDVYGDPRNAGVKLSAALAAWDSPLLTFNCTGLYRLTIDALVSFVEKYLYNASTTGTTGAASAGTAHTHDYTYPTALTATWNCTIWTRASSSGSWSQSGSAFQWRTPTGSFQADSNGENATYIRMHRATAGSQMRFRWVGATVNNHMIGAVNSQSVLIELLGAAPSSPRSLTSFQSAN